jgi:PKHD-type hydroxylase
MAEFLACWMKKGSVPFEICDMIIKESESLEWEKGQVGPYAPSDTKNRDVDITWLSNNHWLEGILINNGLYANRECNWNFEGDIGEHVQIAKYTAGHYHDWHMDSCFNNGSDFIRKISVMLMLSDQTEYEGGHFILQHKGDQKIPLDKGDIIAFPSFIWHSVTPVITGTRHTAIAWINGKMFK